MSSSAYQSGQCAETKGFLFSHHCGEAATHECSQCGKPICAQHSSIDQGGAVLCTSCAQRRTDEESFSNTSDSPYWYTHHHYQGYWWHDHDFTDHDEGALSEREAGVDDLEQFEKDMGAS